MVISISIIGGDVVGDSVVFEVSSEPIPIDLLGDSIHKILTRLIGSARFLMRGGTLHPTDPWGKEQNE